MNTSNDLAQWKRHIYTDILLSHFGKNYFIFDNTILSENEINYKKRKNMLKMNRLLVRYIPLLLFYYITRNINFHFNFTFKFSFQIFDSSFQFKFSFQIFSSNFQSKFSIHNINSKFQFKFSIQTFISQPILTKSQFKKQNNNLSYFNFPQPHN